MDDMTDVLAHVFQMIPLKVGSGKLNQLLMPKVNYKNVNQNVQICK